MKRSALTVGASHSLLVEEERSRAYGVTLNEEGYNLSDGNSWDAYDETVACERCGARFPLERLMVDE